MQDLRAGQERAGLTVRTEIRESKGSFRVPISTQISGCLVSKTFPCSFFGTSKPFSFMCALELQGSLLVWRKEA